MLLRSKALETDQAKDLLKTIRKRGTAAFHKFVEVLLESETQSNLGKQLKDGAGEWKMDDEKYGKSIRYKCH